MDSRPVILIVEDDKPIRNFICASFEAQNYKCIEAQNGRTAISLVYSYNPDIIVIDLGLPDMDGLEVIAAVRPVSQAAIIVVSARGHEREKVEALDMGADDYLTKPFGAAELLARIRVACRHKGNGQQAEYAAFAEFVIGELKIDFRKRRVLLAGAEIHLTPFEYKLMALMAKHAGRVLTHNFIQNEVWGAFSSDDTQSLRVFMANIRRKIEKDPAQPRYILTEVGVGYRLADE